VSESCRAESRERRYLEPHHLTTESLAYGLLRRVSQYFSDKMQFQKSLIHCLTTNFLRKYLTLHGHKPIIPRDVRGRRRVGFVID